MKSLMFVQQSVALAFVAGLGACEDAGRYPAPSDAMRAGITAQCELAHSCRGSYDPSQHDLQAFEELYQADVEACVNTVLASLDQIRPAYLAAVDLAVEDGSALYDGAAAELCVDLTAGQSCVQFFEQDGQTYAEPSACQAVFEGTVGAGGACFIGPECVTGDCIDGICVADA